MEESKIVFRLVPCEYVDEPVILCNRETMKMLEDEVKNPQVNHVGFTILNEEGFE